MTGSSEREHEKERLSQLPQTLFIQELQAETARAEQEKTPISDLYIEEKRIRDQIDTGLKNFSDTLKVPEGFRERILDEAKKP